MVRVGRHGDKCKRYGVSGVDRINKEENEVLQNRMYDFIKTHHPINKDLIKMMIKTPLVKQKKQTLPPANNKRID
jgi:hypothetical protein